MFTFNTVSSTRSHWSSVRGSSVSWSRVLHGAWLLSGACALAACDDATSSNEAAQSVTDAGVDASAPITSSAPSDGGFFGAMPSVRPSSSASSAPSVPLPAGYEGPTADDPIVTCGDAVATGASPLIDDFEDG